MCYLLNETYDCPHTSRTTVPCASPTPCPRSHLQTRALAYPTPCHSCTGHTPLDPATRDCWNNCDVATHAEAAGRYTTHLAHFMSACLSAYNPASTPDDFLKYYAVLDGELRCREHGALPADCRCDVSGVGSWEYNLAYTLRSQTSLIATDAFLDNPVVAATISGSLRSEVTSMVKQLSQPQSAGPDNLHPNLPPYPVSKIHLFSTSESSRRLDFSLSARDEALTQMRHVLASLPHHVARPAEEAMRFRAQVAATFSLFATMDSGLSPIRADTVLSRLATLVLDPTFFLDVPPEFDDTRILIGALTSWIVNPELGDPEGANPIADLHSGLTTMVSTARNNHAAQLEPLVPYNYAFDLSTDPTEDRTNTPCPLRSCTRSRSPPPQTAPHADPRAYHALRVKVRNCGHVLGRHCAFKEGMNAANFMDGVVLFNCPACGAEGELVRATGGGEGGNGEVRRRRWAWPLEAARSGEMEEGWVRYFT